MQLHLEGEQALEQETVAFLHPTRVGRRSGHGTGNNWWIRSRRSRGGGDGGGSGRGGHGGEDPFQMIHNLLERV